MYAVVASNSAASDGVCAHKLGTASWAVSVAGIIITIVVISVVVAVLVSARNVAYYYHHY